MNQHDNQILIVIILLTPVLVTGIFTVNVQSVFADSRILKQDTKQNANCDTVGTASQISDSCNQRTANNVNKSVPRTAGPPVQVESQGEQGLQGIQGRAGPTGLLVPALPTPPEGSGSPGGNLGTAQFCDTQFCFSTNNSPPPPIKAPIFVPPS